MTSNETKLNEIRFVPCYDVFLEVPNDLNIPAYLNCKMLLLK